MKPLSRIGRPVVMILLFIAGALLIWYVGRQRSSSEKGSVRFDEPSRPSPTSPKPAAPPESNGNPALQISGPQTVTTEEKLSGIVTTERGSFIAADPILFNPGASTLREASIPNLDKIAKLLREKPDIELEIIGHTDNLEPEYANQKVSSERAAAVMDYLVWQGIDRSRLRSKGMGSLDPISSNDTQWGRQANHRIEFLILKRGSTQ
jgi:outer membrane protein OmpA-like peptidoglycan-associated protein